MANKRDDILEHLKPRTEAILPAVAVYKERMTGIKDLAAISIFANGDDSETANHRGGNIRTEEIVFVIAVEGKEDYELGTGEVSVDKALNDIINTIENEYNVRRETFGGLVEKVDYASTRLEKNLEGDKIKKVAVMTFRATYLERFA